MATKTADLLPGALDLLILKAVSLSRSMATVSCCESCSSRATRCRSPQGSLYPALYRLDHQGLITAEWGESENRRKAKFYTLTSAGRKRLREEADGWKRWPRRWHPPWKPGLTRSEGDPTENHGQADSNVTGTQGTPRTQR